MDRIKKLVKEKLCKKGEAYRKRRMAAGEKSSAYLSGRAVKVCKGQMSGKKKKTNEIGRVPRRGIINKFNTNLGVVNDKPQVDSLTPEERIKESLRDWFKKEDWVRINNLRKYFR